MSGAGPPDFFIKASHVYLQPQTEKPWPLIKVGVGIINLVCGVNYLDSEP